MVLWCVAFVQTLVTRWYVSGSAFQQAFARNKIVLTQYSDSETDMRNIQTGNVCREGVVAGRLNRKNMSMEK